MGIFRRKKEEQRPLCAAVIAAAGSSSRMGEDKILLPLGEEPVIVRTVRALECSELISEIVIVTREALVVPIAELCKEYSFTKVTKVVRGGASRTESVMLGVKEVAGNPKLIAIHDGARPFVPVSVVNEAIRQAEKSGAAAPALPVKDTDGRVERTVDRAPLRAVQTPQVFDADLIRAAVQKALEDKAEITDDCSAVERLGMKVVLTEGAEENFKLTTQGDLMLARGLVRWMEENG